MNSPSRPQVPAKDVLGNLARQGKYKDIGSYLDSSNYTRETKIEWILFRPRDHTRKSLFHYICEFANSPIYVIEKVFDILGGKELSSPVCTDLFCENIFDLWYRDTNNSKETKITLITGKMMEKLRNLPEVQIKLLLAAIMKYREDSYSSNFDALSIVFEHIKSIPYTQSIPLTKYNIERIKQNTKKNVMYSFKEINSLSKGGQTYETRGYFVKELHEATILEIALHKRISSDIIVEMIERGKTELVMLSKRSLIEGAICEKHKYSFQILERLLHYGGRELVMVERSWWNNNTRRINIFQLLSENKTRLEGNLPSILTIMGLMLDKGGKEFILKTNEDGQSILHTFAYFGHDELVPIVKRIVDIGGESFLKIEDKRGNTTLHHLLRQSNIARGYLQTLVDIMKLLLDKEGKELVLKTNEAGQSILHTYAYFRHDEIIPIVKRIIRSGGERLLKIQDKRGNTILHHLSQQQHYIPSSDWKTQIEIINLMLDEGGNEIVLKTNEAGQSILYNYSYFERAEFASILRRIVEIGGVDLLKIQDKRGNTILHHLLVGHSSSRDYWKNLVEMIGLILDKGGKGIVLKTNEDGQSILHTFAYFNHEEFVPIVRRIVDLGGADLLKIQDKKGDTILHHFLHRSSISRGNSKGWSGTYIDELNQTLELYLNTFAYNNEVVIIRNKNGKTALDLALQSQNQPSIDVLMELTGKESILEQDKHEGKTVLHKACELKMYDEIRRLAEIGGKELIMKQDLQGNSPLHLLPICCDNYDKQFQCVRSTINFGGKDLFNCRNKKGDKPLLISQVDQYTHDIQQSMQKEIEQLKEQLVLEEKRGQNEIEIVKKWHEERHEKSMTVLEEKEKEIQVLQEVKASMKRIIEEQKQMIDKLQKEKQQFNEESQKKEQENNALKQDIETLKQQIASSPSEPSIEVTDIFDTHSEEELIVDDFEEGSFSRATKEFHEVDECKVQREKLQTELECSICFDPFDDPHIVPECCHRFCFKCIDTAIKKSGKECPMCRKRISSKRSLRRDELIGKISKIVFSDDKEGYENKDQNVTKSTKAKSANEIQQREEEVASMKNKIETQEEILKQNASKFSQLEKRIAEKDDANLSLKGVITAKEHENNTLKQEINTLKQYQEEATSMKEKLDSQEVKLKQSDSNISQLEKRIAEKDGVITAKEHENNSLKQENDTLKRQLSSSLSSKRSRDENESSDNDEDDIIPRRKRSKTNASEASRFYMNEVLESENEDLLEQLKKEKTSHSKTIERLENARKKLKEVYRTHQQ